MLKLKNLKMKNFLSFGNAVQEIDLNREELVLILGENLDMGGEDAGSRNGVGKTGILNGISYALFGWAVSNIKKEHLINKSNGKNMEVSLDFESNGKTYKIVRGRRPNNLEFYVSGTKQQVCENSADDDAQGDSRETQLEIEKILGMSQAMFCQVVALNTYTVPFLFQRVHEQRAIIEQLLGITLLSEKAEKLKKDIKSVNEQIVKEQIRIKSTEEANTRIQMQINSLLTKQKKWALNHTSSLVELEEAISFLSTIDIEKELVLYELWDEYKILKSYKAELADSLRQEKILLTKEDKKQISLQLDLDSLKDQCCHTCHQKLQTDVHTTLLNNKQIEYERVTSEKLRLEQTIADLERRLADFPMIEVPIQPSYDTIAEAYDHKNKLSLLMQQYETAKNSEDPYKDSIFDMKNSALETIDFSTMNELTKFNEHQEFLLKLLVNKDSFIRKKIIDQNLSYLNSRLDHYLTKLGLPHSVIFENDLSVSINELGRELSPGNLSRGEMARLSLGLSLSFRDVYENLYQKINLFFADEILDNGLDILGGLDAMNLLRDLTRDQGKSVWLISHKDELISKANTICKIIKESGFSTISFDE